MKEEQDLNGSEELIFFGHIEFDVSELYPRRNKKDSQKYRFGVEEQDVS